MRLASAADLLRARAESVGDRVAVETEAGRRTYAELDITSDRLACGLVRSGIGRGNHVAIFMRNSLAHVDVWFAGAKIGVVEIPLNVSIRGSQLQYFLEHVEASTVVCDSDLLPTLSRVLDRLPSLRRVVVAGRGTPHVPLPPNVDVLALESLYDDGVFHDRHRATRDDAAAIMFTSGTTGPSKGVVLTHNVGLKLARHNVSVMAYTSDDVLFTAFPLFHQSGRYAAFLTAMQAGAPLIMHEKLSVSRFWDICREKRVTAFTYVGSLIPMLWNQEPRPDDADNPVRFARGAGAPPEIFEAFERRFGLTLVELYGLTEVPTAIENPRVGRRVGSCGRESARSEVRVVDEDDSPVAAGVRGEIVLRPKEPGIMMRGYYKRPDAALEVMRNLWFHTGDRGYMSEDGFVFFVDRMKDSIRRRGENVSAWEVEQVVSAFEGVVGCAAYGVPSDLSEEEVMVAVELDRRIDLASLVEHCRHNLAGFAVPRYFRVVEQLPRTPTQRVQKSELRAEGVTDDAWDAHARVEGS